MALIRFDPDGPEPDPAALARSFAWQLVRAYAAVARLLDETLLPPGATATSIADDLEAMIAARLRDMMVVFDRDDLDSAILHVAEAIDNLGNGDTLDPSRVPEFLERADRMVVAPDAPPLSDAAEAARARLLARGVALVGEHRTPRDWTVQVTAPTPRMAAEAVADVLPGATSEWLSCAPHEIGAGRCTAWRDRGRGLLRVWVSVGEQEHVDEVLVAEDEERIVVLATVCRPVSGAIGRRREEPHRVWIERPLGARPVIDGFSGRELARDG